MTAPPRDSPLPSPSWPASSRLEVEKFSRTNSFDSFLPSFLLEYLKVIKVIERRGSREQSLESDHVNTRSACIRWCGRASKFTRIGRQPLWTQIVSGRASLRRNPRSNGGLEPDSNLTRNRSRTVTQPLRLRLRYRATNRLLNLCRIYYRSSVSVRNCLSGGDYRVRGLPRRDAKLALIREAPFILVSSSFLFLFFSSSHFLSYPQNFEFREMRARQKLHPSLIPGTFMGPRKGDRFIKHPTAIPW